MRSLFARLRDARGTATIEFAAASLFLFGIIMVGLDFGVYEQQKLKLGSAVEQAAVLAYNSQVSSSTAAISSYVATATGVTPSITCNGTATCGDGKCSCLTAGGGFTPAASCNAVCTGSTAISGNYLKISATATYHAIVVPDKYLGGASYTQSAVVRLQ